MPVVLCRYLRAPRSIGPWLPWRWLTGHTKPGSRRAMDRTRTNATTFAGESLIGVTGSAVPEGRRSMRPSALLIVAAAYLGIVAVLLGLAREVLRWGVVVADGVRSELDGALVFHVVGVGVVAGLYALVRSMRLEGLVFSRLLLMLMPFGLLASVDQVVGIPFPRITPPTGMSMPHPTRGWSSKPGWTGMEAGATIRINTLGLRGEEIPIPKPSEERRILFLGDSVTFGSYVAEEAIFTTRLQNMLDGEPFGDSESAFEFTVPRELRNLASSTDRDSDSPRRSLRFATEGVNDGKAVESAGDEKEVRRRVRIVNASAPAYAPWQEVDLLLHEGLATQPEAVVFVFCLNDVLEPFQLERFGGYWRGFEPATPARLESSGIHRAARQWKTWRARPSKGTLSEERGRFSPSSLLAHPDSDDVKRGWAMVFESLAKIVSACRERSIPVALVAAPHQYQLSPDPRPEPSPQAVLADFAAEHQLPYLDLLPAFREHMSTTGVELRSLFADPLHFSAQGHGVAATSIAEFLRRLGWFAMPRSDTLSSWRDTVWLPRDCVICGARLLRGSGLLRASMCNSFLYGFQEVRS